MAGFSVYLTDGKVVKWSPIMEESRAIQVAGARASPEEQSFQLFLATDSLTNLANKVDSDGRADATDLRDRPNLMFSAKVLVGRNGNEPPGEQTVILVLSEQDASRLRDLTENHFGKRLVIVYRKQAIAAPVISSSITSRQLMFVIKTGTLLDGIHNR